MVNSFQASPDISAMDLSKSFCGVNFGTSDSWTCDLVLLPRFALGLVTVIEPITSDSSKSPEVPS